VVGSSIATGSYRHAHIEQWRGVQLAADHSLADLPYLSIVERGARINLVERRKVKRAVLEVIIGNLGFCVETFSDRGR
jgi:hypothetical protein